MERLKINGGAISSHIVEKGVVIDKDLPMSHLRVRSKRATVSDCISFLRQGVDVCVFSTFHNPEDSDDEKSDEPVSFNDYSLDLLRKPLVSHFSSHFV